jgi:hypothetical protein
MFDAAAHHASHGRKRTENAEKKLFSVNRVPFFGGYKEAQIEPQVHLLNRNNPVECNARKQSNFGIEVYFMRDIRNPRNFQFPIGLVGNWKLAIENWQFDLRFYIFPSAFRTLSGVVG